MAKNAIKSYSGVGRCKKPFLGDLSASKIVVCQCTFDGEICALIRFSKCKNIKSKNFVQVTNVNNSIFKTLNANAIHICKYIIGYLIIL